jgi:uncharacterized iron-regulated protein
MRKNQVMGVLAEQKEFPVLLRNFFFKLISVLVLIGITWGCALAPKKPYVKDSSKSFEEDTIISAETGKPVSFEKLVAELNGSQVIYVGEQHTDQSHHQIQLKIIKAVFEEHPSVIVGMEMFDHSYQNILDMWSDGELDEETFLRRTHWYANWRFNFSLYRDILNFVRDNRIRLVALNIPFHIPSKIRVGGLENLRDDEKKHLPQSINTTNTAHRDYVKTVFEQHHRHFKGGVKFEDFYAAQAVWEDAMAEAVAENLNGCVMVVLVGNGHIQYKYGVPDRAFDRTGASFRTVYPVGVDNEADLKIADYIWVTP